MRNEVKPVRAVQYRALPFFRRVGVSVRVRVVELRPVRRRWETEVRGRSLKTVEQLVAWQTCLAFGIAIFILMIQAVALLFHARKEFKQ